VDLVELYGRLPAVAPDRPATRVNMIASVDGAASAGGLSGALGGTGDKAVFATLRSLADVILVGSSTMRQEGYGPARLDLLAQQWRLESGLTAVPPIAVLTAACRLDWDAPFFSEAVERPLVVTVATADVADRARAAEVADVVLAGDDRVDIAAALAGLGGRGFTNVLIEGGPSIITQVAAAGCLDELCLSVSPTLTGGGAGRILAGPPLEVLDPLRLCSIVEDDSFLFLRYRRADQPTSAGPTLSHDPVS
jgi:riboflavin biosynthesis pyrimidine reductase